MPEVPRGGISEHADHNENEHRASLEKGNVNAESVVLGGLPTGSFFRDKLRRWNIYSRKMRGIGSPRIWSCAVAIILWASGLQVSLYAQIANRLSPKVMAAMNAPPVELKDDDPPLLRAKKERLNAALKEAKARADLYNRGLTRIPELIEMVAERLFPAELDLYDQPDQKAQVLQRQLDVYREAEANLEKQVKDGLMTEAELERLRYGKFSVEMELISVKNGQENRESKAETRPQ
jgi:hypothetical protein